MVRSRGPLPVLRHQLPRDLWSKKTRYALLAALIVVGIAAAIGSASASQASLSALRDGRAAANLEDGAIETTGALGADQIAAVEATGVVLEDTTYADVAGPQGSTLRLFESRSRVDRINLDAGSLPTADGEAVVEKHYAAQHAIGVGDAIEAGGRQLRVTGIGSSPDYTTVVPRASDFAVDSRAFGTAFVAPGTMSAWPAGELAPIHGYAVDLGASGMSIQEAAALVMRAGAPSGVVVVSVLDADSNGRITTGANDLALTESSSYIAGILALVVIAYLLAVMVAEDIRQESPVIGTFYALGLTPGELIRHYLTLPVALAVVCSCAGTGAGLLLAPYLASDAAYYSLPEISIGLTGRAVVFGVGAPVLIVLAVGALVLRRRLTKEPLALLRRELGTGRRAGARLTRFSFPTRFRLRGAIREWRTSAVMLVGVVLAVLFMVLGLGMRDSIESFADSVHDTIPFSHLYVLTPGQEPPGALPEGAQALAVRPVSLETAQGSQGSGSNAVLLGLEEADPYLGQGLDLSDGRIYVSSATALREGLDDGDPLTLRGPGGESRSAVVAGVVDYPQPALMSSLDTANALAGQPATATNAVMASAPSPELDAVSAQVISRAGMEEDIDALTDALGPHMTTLLGASTIMTILVVVLLMRMVVDKEAYAISLMKALGYDEREVGRLYLGNYLVVILASLALGIPLSYLVMRPIWLRMISTQPTAFRFALDPASAAIIVALVLACYALARFMGARRLAGVDLGEALKDRE